MLLKITGSKRNFIFIHYFLNIENVLVSKVSEDKECILEALGTFLYIFFMVVLHFQN